MTDENGIRDFNELLKTSSEIAKAYVRSEVFEGDIVCSIGPSFGKLMITPRELHGANLTQGTARVAVNKKNSARFIFWALRAPSSYQQWDASCGGATFRALNLGPLADTFIVTPTFEEQQKIAHFLDHETAKIDTLIEQQQQLIQLLKEKRQAVISHAVTKGLSSLNGGPNAPMKDSGVEWLGEVPANWVVSNLDFALIGIGDVDHYMPKSVDTGIPYVMTGDLKEFASNINFEGCKQISLSDYTALSKKIKCTKGDVIMARYATIGTVSYVDIDMNFVVSYSCVTIKPNLSKVIGLYLYYYFKSDAFLQGIQSQINTNTQGNVGISDLKKIKIAIPPLPEQGVIIQYLQSKIDHFDYLSDKCETSIQLAQERRTALISAAVTGKIDVRNWQAPNN